MPADRGRVRRDRAVELDAAAAATAPLSWNERTEPDAVAVAIAPAGAPSGHREHALADLAGHRDPTPAGARRSGGWTP